MAEQHVTAFPDVAISETATNAAVIVFSLLAIAFILGLICANWYRKKREREGIYSKYKLPSDPDKARR